MTTTTQTKISIKNAAMNKNTDKIKIENVAKLYVLNINTEIETRQFGDGEKAFSVTGFEMDNVFYRVPASVITQIKDLLNEVPDLEKVRIKMYGEGMQTRYVVTPS